jgi:hypothetical protein
MITTYYRARGLSEDGHLTAADLAGLHRGVAQGHGSDLRPPQVDTPEQPGGY